MSLLYRKLGIIGNTVVDWKQFVCDICHEYFMIHPIILGGRGHIEIDESCCVRRKHKRGNELYEKWVFGRYDVQMRESFMVIVDHRDAATLFRLLKIFILPGTTVILYLWAVSNTIHNIRYNHLTVNYFTVCGSYYPKPLSIILSLFGRKQRGKIGVVLVHIVAS